MCNILEIGGGLGNLRLVGLNPPAEFSPPRELSSNNNKPNAPNDLRFQHNKPLFENLLDLCRHLGSVVRVEASD